MAIIEVHQESCPISQIKKWRNSFSVLSVFIYKFGEHLKSALYIDKYQTTYRSGI